jgi:mono/diheme cytochrome c family protein
MSFTHFDTEVPFARFAERGVSYRMAVWASVAIFLKSTGFLLSLANPTFASDLSTAVQQKFGKHCFDCHGNGSEEGGFNFETLASGKYGDDTQAKWETVWRNVRAQTMPPAEAESPAPEVRSEWVHWIQKDVFKLDPTQIDPGHVVLRRLNRSEYKESIRELTGVDFDVREEFPADDTGYGFDTIGEALTLSPVLLEKYLAAASDIVAKFTQFEGPTPVERYYWGNQWKMNAFDGPEAKSIGFEESVSFYLTREVKKEGRYRIELDWKMDSAWTSTPQEAQLIFSFVDRDGKPKILGEQKVDFATGGKGLISAELDLPKGDIKVIADFKSINSDSKTNVESVKELKYKFSIRKLNLIGPLDGSEVEYREQARKMFFNGPPPTPKDGEEAKSADHQAKIREHMKVIVRSLADKAFRRPIDEPTLDRICDIGMRVANEPGKRYEHGAATAMQLVLASPRFLYRVEEPKIAQKALAPNASSSAVPIDDYSLATRLSFFLWGGPPDDKLLQIAAAGEMHTKLLEQFDRMIAVDWRLERGIENFVGQWLQTRDVEDSQIDAKVVLRLRSDEEANDIFDWKVRQAMTKETLKMYQHLLVENRPAEELLNARYTFLNEPLAKFYGIEGVRGEKMQKVELPPESHRRGVLSHGSLLVVTSNPTRTSPVKRGLFLLDNLLGTPAPPAPPNVPALEESKTGNLKNASLREILEFHRRDPGCAGCHDRMDPLGLAMENFNAIGQWRDVEKGRPAFRGRPAEPDQPIDPSGKLLSGETFASVAELAELLADKRKEDYYRCLTEKLMTFALGRGLTYRDTTAVDNIVEVLKKENGSMKSLYRAILTSVPFTHCRTTSSEAVAATK